MGIFVGLRRLCDLKLGRTWWSWFEGVQQVRHVCYAVLYGPITSEVIRLTLSIRSLFGVTSSRILAMQASRREDLNIKKLVSARYAGLSAQCAEIAG